MGTYVESFTLNGVNIPTTVTYDPNVVDDYIIRWLGSTNYSNNKTKVFGFDAEWELRNPRAPLSNCATLQICDGDSCLIVQLSRFGISVPQSLVNFLRLPNYTFVGFGIKDNVAKLEKKYGFGCKNAVELGPLVASVMERSCLSCCGVDELLFVVNKLDLRRHRPLNISFEWGSLKLSTELAKVATISVYSYHKIGSRLLSLDWSC